MADDEVLEYSSDDLPDVYHTLTVPYLRARSNAVGPYLTANEIKAFCPCAWKKICDRLGEGAGGTQSIGAAKGVPQQGWFQPCLGRLPMGDLNAVDFACIIHANVLIQSGVVSRDELLGIHTPLPAGGFAAGLIVDDVAFLQTVKENPSPSDKREDIRRLEKIDSTYAAAGLGAKRTQRVRGARRGKIWGAELDGEVGSAGFTRFYKILSVAIRF